MFIVACWLINSISSSAESSQGTDRGSRFDADNLQIRTLMTHIRLRLHLCTVFSHRDHNTRPVPCALSMARPPRATERRAGRPAASTRTARSYAPVQTVTIYFTTRDCDLSLSNVVESVRLVIHIAAARPNFFVLQLHRPPRVHYVPPPYAALIAHGFSFSPKTQHQSRSSRSSTSSASSTFISAPALRAAAGFMGSAAPSR